MNTIDIALDRLVGAILDSAEYREYDKQRNHVKQYPELKAQIDEYRKKNFELQNGEENVFEKLSQLEREYAGLRENPVASDFLAAELAFCRLMQDINLRLTEALHFE